MGRSRETLSRKGAKSRTHGRKLRSTGTKARTRVGRPHEPRAELEKKLAEALEQQAATSEVLRVISSSSGTLEPVFETMLAKAVDICEAKFGTLMLREGDAFRIMAMHGALPPEYVEERRRRPVMPATPGTGLAHLIAAKRPIQIADILEEPAYYNERARALIDIAGARTLVTVPMLKEDELVGSISIYRKEVCPFSDKQIELLTNFAAQAVIAIENTRLLNELRRRTNDLSEALEQQTATSEVLGVISSSPGQLEPVFEAMLANATRLCEARFASLNLAEGDQFRRVAVHNAPPALVDHWRRHPTMRPHPGSAFGRAALTREVVQVDDIRTTPAYVERDPIVVAGAELAGYRTIIAVPMLKENALVGVISIYRQEVLPFTDKQIELVKNFAKQAVIAIENTRLLNELRESLQQQTATADVLKVISRSTFDLQAVLDTLVESAAKLCEADMATINRQDGSKYRQVAHYGQTPAQEAYMAAHPIPAGRGSLVGRTIAEGKVVHISDVQADPEFTFRGSSQISGVRTMLGVPMLREGTPIGVINLQRIGVRPFTAKQIELAETFADQAVIAIENVRLFDEVQARTRELSEALEQQKATSEVLEVISSSPGELEPVFEATLARATRLCGAEFGVLNLDDGNILRMAAVYNVPPALAATQNVPFRVHPQSGQAEIRRTKQVVHIDDIRAMPPYLEGDPRLVALADLGGARTTLAVPMLKEDALLGSITIYRQEVRPFSEKQIDLLKNFARQAVIAIENTRLLNELRELLQQQTATADVLKVISRSTFDLKAVLETLTESAARLCDAFDAVLLLREGETLVFGAHHGPIPMDFDRWPVGRAWTAGRAVVDRKAVHVDDLAAMADEFPEGQAMAVRLGHRTILSLPLLRGDEAIGSLSIRRTEVRPFTDKQIELATTFADQAVIAIENARLFDEVQARNRDLTALGEVGRAVSSTLDLKAVLKTIIDRAVDLSGTDGGSIFYYREDVGRFELGETSGFEEEVVERYRKLDIAAGRTGLSEAIGNRQPLQIPDITKRASNPLRDSALEAGLRAALIVPLLGGEAPLGALVLQRREPGAFSDAVVSLMQSFADQSAIALENARLFNEIAQKSRELEIASQHKSQFVANMSHELRTPLAAILGYAELIQEGFYGPLPEKSMDVLTRIRANGKHLLGLINTVLDIAKVESGQFSLNLAEYALDNVVETVRAATESLAETKKLSLKTDVAGPLPVGVGDEQRLTQVLLNLVGNAIKFTDSGEVRITAKAVDGHFAVGVTDTGPGIPLEEQKRVFEQFHQVDNSSTKAKGGTGLGLAIAKQIVEMHGGRIWVELTLGQGATFQMELPIRAEIGKGTA